MNGNTYAAAGVNIDAGMEFTDMIKERIAKAWPDVDEEIGGFAGGGPLPAGAKRFCGGVDGTGTKIILAALTENLHGIGQDAVAMAAVDAYIENGAPVHTIWDVLNVASLKPALHIQIIDSIIAACEQVGCKLAGGETAELPDMFPYRWMANLDVFAVSFPTDENPYAEVCPGQSIWGWKSYGPGSNGFSLLRKIFQLKPSQRPRAWLDDLFRHHGAYTAVRKRLDAYDNKLGMTLGEALLVPTPIWIKQMEGQVRNHGTKFAGHAHITGGGLVDNVPRILPQHCKAVIDLDAWTRPPIFRIAERLGRVEQAEMLRVFNNGIMVASIASEAGGLADHPEVSLIGTVEPRTGEAQVEFINKFRDDF